MTFENSCKEFDCIDKHPNNLSMKRKENTIVSGMTLKNYRQSNYQAIKKVTEKN